MRKACSREGVMISSYPNISADYDLQVLWIIILVKIGFYNNLYGLEKLLKVFCIPSAGYRIFANYKDRISSMVSPVNLLISSGAIPCRFIDNAIAATASA